MDSRTGLPVVGMVGGGQLARMTHQAAIALGQSLRVLAARPDDGAALVAADVQYRRPHRPGRAARASPRAATWSPSTTSTCPASTSARWPPTGVTVYPAADALRYAQDKRRDAGAARPSWARRCPRWRPVGDAGRRGRRSAREVGWPVVLKAATRRLRRPGRLGGRRRRPRPSWRRCSPAARRLIVEERVRAAAGAGRAWWPARRSGRSRRTRWWRRCSGTASASRCSRPAPGLAEELARRRPSSSPSTSPPSSAWSGCSRSSCSRPPTGLLGQRAGHAPAQLRALDHRGRPDLAVRAAPAGGAGLPAGRHRADRAGRGDGERARRRSRAACRSTSGCTTCSPPTRA